MEDKFWICMKLPQMDKVVWVFLNEANNLWVVKQNEEMIIGCSHLILRHAVFHHKTGQISGFLSSSGEIDDIRTRLGEDLNSVFKNDTVKYEDGRFIVRTMDGINTIEKSINYCPYLDMESLDNPQMIAIYPGEIVWGK